MGKQGEGVMYWVCHTRGPNFQLLEKRGFVTFYPEVDDYVFLKVSPENESLLKRQIELCVHFVKNGNLMVTITDEELDKMRVKSVDQVLPGTYVKALIGICENLEGEVLSRSGDKILCRWKGYNRTYDVEVQLSEVVLRDKVITHVSNELDLIPA